MNEKGDSNNIVPIRSNLPAWIQAIAAIAIVMITAFYTYYAREQAFEMRKSTEAATKGAEAATRAANIAQSALQENDKQFKINARPFIVKDSLKLLARPSSGLLLKAELIIKNCGRTPALNVTGFVKMSLTRSKFIVNTNEWRKKAFAELGHIGEIGSDMSRRIPIESDNPLTEKDMSGINNNSIRIFVYGSIVYEDIFKNKHITDLCGYFKPEEADLFFKTCDEGNNVE